MGHIFEKGHTKIGGRKKGTPNKDKQVAKKVVEILVPQSPSTDTTSEGFDNEVIRYIGKYWMETTLEKDWNRLEPIQRFQVFEKLYQYLEPKKASQQSDISINASLSLENDLNKLVQEFNEEEENDDKTTI